MSRSDLTRWVRRGLSSTHGRVLAPLVSPLLQVDHLGPARPARFPFLVVVSVDAEAGYLRPDLSCVWSDVEPRALQGFTHGIPVLLELAREARVPFSFLLSTQCFVRNGRARTGVHAVLERLLDEGHELGLHLHPRTDEPLHRALGRRLPYASAHFYDEDEQAAMLSAARELVAAELGAEVEGGLRSFRWGNWALSTHTVAALERTGFEVDSTALPGLRGNLDDDRRFDWSRLARAHPFRLSRADYQDAGAQDSTVLELPVPTFRLLRPGLADPSWGPLLASVLLHYLRNADRSRAPFAFVVCTHSCEMVHADGSATCYAANLREFLGFAAGLEDVRFRTLTGAARAVGAAAAPASDDPAGART